MRTIYITYIFYVVHVVDVVVVDVVVVAIIFVEGVGGGVDVNAPVSATNVAAIVVSDLVALDAAVSATYVATPTTNDVASASDAFDDGVVDIFCLYRYCYFRFILDNGRYAKNVNVSSAHFVSSKSTIDEGVFKR